MLLEFPDNSGMPLARNRGTANRTFLTDGVTGVTHSYEINVGSARVIVASPRRWFSILLFPPPSASQPPPPHPHAHKSEGDLMTEHRAIEFSVALRPQRPYGLLGDVESRVQDGHLDVHTLPELCKPQSYRRISLLSNLWVGQSRLLSFAGTETCQRFPFLVSAFLQSPHFLHFSRKH